MKLKLRSTAVVLTAALPLAAATIPTKAEAFGFLLAPALIGSAIIGAGSSAWAGGYGGGGYAYGGYGCCVQIPPPPPPCCYYQPPPPPPPCCYYGGRWGAGRGGWDGY